MGHAINNLDITTTPEEDTIFSQLTADNFNYYEQLLRKHKSTNNGSSGNKDNMTHFIEKMDMILEFLDKVLK